MEPRNYRGGVARSTPPATRTAQPTQSVRIPAFHVVDVRLLPESAGNLKAFVALKVGPVTLRDFRVIQQPGQSAWVAPAQKSWQDPKTGETKYSSLVDLPAEWKQPIQNAVIAAYEDERRKAGQAA